VDDKDYLFNKSVELQKVVDEQNRRIRELEAENKGLKMLRDALPVYPVYPVYPPFHPTANDPWYQRGTWVTTADTTTDPCT